MDKLYAMLLTLGLPVAYNHFEETDEQPIPAPPYIVYLFADSNNFGADCKVYEKINNFQVELYTKIKEPNAELLIENLFDDNDIFYDKTETYIDSEKLYEVLYEIQM